MRWKGGVRLRNHFTKEEYRRLLEIICAGMMVINGNRAPEDHLEEYEEIEQYIYSLAKDYDFENLVDYDEKYKRYFTTPEFDNGKIKDLVAEYDDVIFWSMLAFNLAKRDTYKELEGKKADRKTIITSIFKKEAEYSNEFYENGLENVKFKQTLQQRS